MKTLNFLIAFCFIFVFSTNNVKAQKETGTQTVDWSFSPYQDGSRVLIPCLEEVVSGTITEYQSFTNNTYHVRPRGVLQGHPSGEDYEISYEFNFFGGSVGADVSLWHNTMLLKHDNKIVAVIHLAGRFVINGNGVIIQDVFVESVNCK